MRVIFLSFEAILTAIWFWSTFWMIDLLANHQGDWGTVVGMLLFLAFGVGTAWMLVHELLLMSRQRAAMHRPPTTSLR
jgi:hypothetical protein